MRGQDMREPLRDPDVHRAARTRCDRLALAKTDNGPSARQTQTTEHAARQNPTAHRLLDGSARGIAAQLMRRRHTRRPPNSQILVRLASRPVAGSNSAPRTESAARIRRGHSAGGAARGEVPPHGPSVRHDASARLTDRCLNPTMDAVEGPSHSDPFIGAEASRSESPQERRHAPVIVAGSGPATPVQIARSLRYDSFRCPRPRFNSKPRAST